MTRPAEGAEGVDGEQVDGPEPAAWCVVGRG
jgi:hypothetical protein